MALHATRITFNMDKRILGKTGHKSTSITLGGAIFLFPISVKKEDGSVDIYTDPLCLRRYARDRHSEKQEGKLNTSLKTSLLYSVMADGS
jgi:hypothetical protein